MKLFSILLIFIFTSVSFASEISTSLNISTVGKYSLDLTNKNIDGYVVINIQGTEYKDSRFSGFLSCNLVYESDFGDYIFYYEYNGDDGKETCTVNFANGSSVEFVKKAYD